MRLTESQKQKKQCFFPWMTDQGRLAQGRGRGIKVVCIVLESCGPENASREKFLALL